MTEAAILDRFLEPVSDCFTPEVARRLVDLRADSATQARIDDLAEKCTAGQLNAVEKAEYDAYIRAIDIVTVLQAKARTVLERAGAE